MPKKVIVRKFGARLVGDAKPIIDSMRAQNRLWNALVEIEHANRDKYREIVTNADDELQALNAEHDTVSLSIDALKKQRNQERLAKRTKKIDKAENYASAIKAQSAVAKDLRERMKECRVRAREAARPLLDELEQQRREAVKAVAREADLWWAHSELVLNAFDVARIRALKTNSTLRFKRFDGNGRVGVRFSPGIVLSAPTTTAMFRMRDALPSELGHLKSVRSGKRIVAADMRVGKKDDDKSFPVASFLVTMHGGMELPQDVPLKTVIATREMRVDKPKWFIVMTFVSAEDTPEDNAAALPEKAVGIDFGWRTARDREWGEETGLRIATLVDTSGETTNITLPPKIIAKFAYADRLRSELDISANEFWERTSPLFTEKILTGMSEDEWLRVIVEKAKRAKRPYPSLMRTVARAHHENPVLGEDADRDMQAWERTAYLREVAMVGTRRRANLHRKHLYLNAAAQLAKECGMIAVKNSDFSALARLDTPDGSENELNERARANRLIAAPSELRDAIVKAALRERRELVKVDPINTTLTCAACGHVHRGTIDDFVFLCENCGKEHDRDENSARNVLNSAMKSLG